MGMLSSKLVFREIFDLIRILTIMLLAQIKKPKYFMICFRQNCISEYIYNKSDFYCNEIKLIQHTG